MTVNPWTTIAMTAMQKPNNRKSSHESDHCHITTSLPLSSLTNHCSAADTTSTHHEATIPSPGSTSAMNTTTTTTHFTCVHGGVANGRRRRLDWNSSYQTNRYSPPKSGCKVDSSDDEEESESDYDDDEDDDDDSSSSATSTTLRLKRRFQRKRDAERLGFHPSFLHSDSIKKIAAVTNFDPRPMSLCIPHIGSEIRVPACFLGSSSIQFDKDENDFDEEVSMSSLSGCWRDFEDDDDDINDEDDDDFMNHHAIYDAKYIPIQLHPDQRE